MTTKTNTSAQLQHILRTTLADIEKAVDLQQLDDVRVTSMGKKGALTEIMQTMKDLPAEERPQFGQTVNEVKEKILEALTVKKSELTEQQLNQLLLTQAVDITLPARTQSLGSLHPVSQARHRIEDLFKALGFAVTEGPEIETEYYNFEALNIPSNHPARAMHDTFYFGDGRLLRTHTSNVQIRAMEKGEPPFRLITCGRVYRCDSDVTHTPMFHQVEGLMVGKQVNFVELKSILLQFFRTFFENDQLTLRLRPSYFPFTEPSAEVDIACVLCQGRGVLPATESEQLFAEEMQCRICKGSGWLEVMGCGMVHPNVLTAVQIDPEQYTGWAFGGGIDRMAMLRYGINDLRVLFDNDTRFLAQFT